MQILSTLSPVEHTFLAGTCVRMNRLIDDQFLWKEVTLKAFRSIIDDASIQILSRTRFRGVHSGVFRLQHLDISLCSNLTDVALNDLCKIASGLLRLNVAGCSKVSDQGAWDFHPTLILLDERGANFIRTNHYKNRNIGSVAVLLQTQGSESTLAGRRDG